MTIQDVLQAVRVGETSDWEFKSAAGGLPGSLWETYSAMGNTEGGSIVLGVSERDGQARLDGLSAEQAERYKRDIWSTGHNRGKVSAALLRENDVQVLPCDSAFLIVIQVPRAGRSQRPVYLNAQPLGNTYRRRHEGDFRCTEEEVRRMFADAEQTPADYRVLTGFGLEDLDAASLTQYRQRLRAAKGEHPWLALDDQELLEKLGGWRFDRESGRSGLTFAGLLLFGRSEALRDPGAAPRFMVDYREKMSPDVRWTDREHPDGTWEGNLFQFYQRVWPKLIRGLAVPFKLEDGQRKDETPVHEALREAFVNALIHADHSAVGGVVVERYPDRYIFENPGTLLVSREQFWRGNLSECRNKALQQMFFMIGGGERAGSGVDKIKAGWRSQHWRAPQLETSVDPDRVRLTLLTVSLIPDETLAFLRNYVGEANWPALSKSELQTLATAYAESGVSNARLQEVLDDHPTDISRMLSGLCEKDLLVSDPRRRWTRYRLVAVPHPHPSPGSSLLKPGSSLLKPGSSLLKPGSSLLKAPDSPSDAGEGIARSGQTTGLGGDESALKAKQPEIWVQLMGTARPVRDTQRADPALVRITILRLCKEHFLGLSSLAELLNRQPHRLRHGYLTPMVREGLLLRRYPTDPNHPQQAYKTVPSNDQA